MKTFTITCGDCGNTGFLHLAGVVPIECHCQDPRDPDSRHHKPLDCSACQGSGRAKRGRCRVCGGCGRVARGSTDAH